MSTKTYYLIITTDQEIIKVDSSTVDNPVDFIDANVHYYADWNVMVNAKDSTKRIGIWTTDYIAVMDQPRNELAEFIKQFYTGNAYCNEIYGNAVIANRHDWGYAMPLTEDELEAFAPDGRITKELDMIRRTQKILSKVASISEWEAVKAKLETIKSFVQY